MARSNQPHPVGRRVRPHQAGEEFDLVAAVAAVAAVAQPAADTSGGPDKSEPHESSSCRRVGLKVGSTPTCALGVVGACACSISMI
jgi:hypothetical protein